MKTIAMVVCLPKETKAARLIKLLTMAIKVVLVVLGATKVQTNVSEVEYDGDLETQDATVSITWQ